MEPRIKQLLEELSELLRDVISESPEAVEKVDAIQDEGYAIHLLLDCQPADDETLDADEAELSDEEAEVQGAVENEAPRASADSTRFVINADDLRFLRSVGIDPTRRANKRRYRPSSESRPAD